MPGGRPAGVKDNPWNPRTRRKPTSLEKANQQKKSMATKAVNGAKKRRAENKQAKLNRPAKNFFGGHKKKASTQSDPDGAGASVGHASAGEVETVATDGDTDTVQPNLSESNPAEDEASAPEADDGEIVVTINNSVPNNTTTINPPDVVANLHINEEDEENEEILDDEDIAKQKKKKKKKWHGVQQKYIEAIQNRIQHEVIRNFKALEEMRWLLEYLKEHHYWICKEDGPKIAEQLGLDMEHVLYYQRVYVWLPDVQWGAECMPACPNCRCNHRVARHGFHANHFGRVIVDAKDNYSTVGCRYVCHTCQENKKNLHESVERLAESQNVEIEVTNVKLQYTFMGWDRRILPLFADGRGKEFPAFLTKRAGLDNSLIDLMRPLFDNGVRPKSLSGILLELHTKEFTRRNIRYERDIAAKKRLDPSIVYPLFGHFADKELYNGHVPTGHYLSHAFKIYSEEIKDHLAKEVKKRDCDIMQWDATFKEAKHLCQYHGEPIFKALVSGMNGIGEIRVQFHVYTDSHDQMVTALESFKRTNITLGMAGPSFFVTDNPKKDDRFIKERFESIRKQQELLDDRVDNSSDQLPSVDEAMYSDAKVKTLSKDTEINQAIGAMRDRMKYGVVGLDCEWPTRINGRGYITKSDKVALIQISYIDNDDNMQVRLIRTSKKKKLPHRLISLLLDNTIRFAGVRVSADLIAIGIDFNIDAITKVVQKDRPNVINLGTYARKRDVVQHGGASLADLCKIVLVAALDKNQDVRCSDWNAPNLEPNQIKYAALDAIVSLAIYNELEKLPDLTLRFTMEDVRGNEGDMVDLVPRYGSVACMATRAATAKIVGYAQCKSPDGISPPLALPGLGSVVVEFTKIYSPGLKLSDYRHTTSNSAATLAHFENCQAIVPVSMLRSHVASDDIRSTPIEEAVVSGISTPTDTDSTLADQVNTNTAGNGRSHGEANEENHDGDDGDFTEEDLDLEIGELTSADIDIIRAAILQTGEARPGKDLLKCKGLSEAPSPSSINNKFSSVLGDIFHAISRTKVPTKHEAKKAFKVAMQDAFLIMNPAKVKELEANMRTAGMTDDDIKNARYYSHRIYRECVDRCAPPPQILYWRVRAVYKVYGHMLDSKTKKPLFNDAAWTSANNVLKEICLGYYSDPPGLQWYTKQLKEDGTIMRNKYGMEMLDCSRGTNRLESYHKGLITTFGSNNMGVEMSVCLLRERRHRHNHRVSERRRFGFPRIGHYDTWEIDELQVLVYKNHGCLIYPVGSLQAHTISIARSIKDSTLLFLL
ncbi:hypothetical protein ACHAXR_006652, partial [Thalassiosira sp. AJA248-18]